jgi:hypothetical protein
VARRFAVHYLVFCERVEYLDPHRPHRDSTLNGVDFALRVPPGTEFPFEPPEFWLFARFYWMRDVPGATQPLIVSCVWLDPPVGDEVEVWQRGLGRVSFHQPYGVSDRAWVFRNAPDAPQFRFPGVGRYEFRLWHALRGWNRQRVVRREYIRVEA